MELAQIRVQWRHFRTQYEPSFSKYGGKYPHKLIDYHSPNKNVDLYNYVTYTY
jgi:hypothetical protein